MTAKPEFDLKEIEGLALEAIQCCQKICDLVSKGYDSAKNDSSALNVLASHAGECCERIRSHLLIKT